MSSIIELNTFGNSIQLTLNLSPSQVAKVMESFIALTEIAQNAREDEKRKEEARKRSRKLLRQAMGYKIASESRKAEKRICEIAHQLARQYGLPIDTIIMRGRIARRKAEKRYIRLRNHKIQRLAQEGAPLLAIADQFGLSKGRISQIINKGE